MCEEPKPVRCVCGKTADLTNFGGGSRVVCGDDDCWWGPEGPSEYRAVKVWNAGMAKLKAVHITDPYRFKSIKEESVEFAEALVAADAVTDAYWATKESRKRTVATPAPAQNPYGTLPMWLLALCGFGGLALLWFRY